MAYLGLLVLTGLRLLWFPRAFFADHQRAARLPLPPCTCRAGTPRPSRAGRKHVFVSLDLIAWTVAFLGLAGTLCSGLRHRPALDL